MAPRKESRGIIVDLDDTILISLLGVGAAVGQRVVDGFTGGG